MKKLLFLSIALFTLSMAMNAQGPAPQNWFLLTPETSDVNGMSIDIMYKDLLKGKTSQTVVVAVIDSGIDIEHEDLKDIIWTNPGEIADNGIDDDKNGYVDDVYGWNFIGGKGGTHISADALEVTRLYKKYSSKFKGVSSDEGLSKKDKKEYAQYLVCKDEVMTNRENAKTRLETMNSRKESVLGMMKAFVNAFGDGEFTMENISAFDTGSDSTAMQGKAIMANVVAQTGAASGQEALDMVSESFKGGVERYNGQLNYHYNPDFDPRDIVGDNYINPHEKLYGNNSVTGPDAFHGTHVAGIIAAVRGNDIGMDGVADNVRIMTIRCVPDGDERDKDVANSIRYAVDNGASIVNMSFGKSFSWNKQIVDDAVKYAAKHDVLLVHAAGNDSKNNDVTDNFPNDTYEKGFFLCPKSPKNWVEVGALEPMRNDKSVASFSNYGNESVDVFAPGNKIYSTIPGSEYGNAGGTSMASPMVAGLAAVLRSYFPTLTARQVKEILANSSDKRDIKVIKPGSDEEVHFSELSTSDGMVNGYNAVKLAEKTKGKKKLKKSKA